MPSGLYRASIREKKRLDDPAKRSLIIRLRGAGVIGTIEVVHNPLNFEVHMEVRKLPFRFHHGKPVNLIYKKS